MVPAIGDGDIAGNGLFVGHIDDRRGWRDPASYDGGQDVHTPIGMAEAKCARPKNAIMSGNSKAWVGFKDMGCSSVDGEGSQPGVGHIWAQAAASPSGRKRKSPWCFRPLFFVPPCAGHNAAVPGLSRVPAVPDRRPNLRSGPAR